MSRADLTFAIPFYRDTRYLEQALRSIQAQTHTEWLAVVCDDAGPEPEAADLVADLADPRITYTRNPENLGLAGNWNRCLDLATTDLVVLLHADDELEPGYAAAVVDAHRRHPYASAVYTRTVIIGDDGRRKRSLPDLVKRRIEPRGSGDVVVAGAAGLANLMRGSFIFCPTLCYRRSALAGLRFEDRWRFVVDLELLVDLLLDGHQLVGIRDRLYRYRRHDESETARLTAGTERFDEEIAIYDEVATRAAAVGWTRAAGTARRKRILKLHLLVRIAGDLAHGRGGPARAKAARLRSIAGRRAT